MKMQRHLFAWMPFFVLSSTVFAAPQVSFSVQGDKLNIGVDADAQPFSVFPENNNLIFVFGHREPVVIDLPKDVRDAFPITRQQILDVDAGVGVSVEFKKWPEFELITQNTPDFSGANASILKIKEALRVSGATPQILKVNLEDQGYNVVPLDGLKDYAEQKLGDIQQHSSYAGMVFSQNNQPLSSVYSKGELILSEDRRALAKVVQSTNTNKLENQAASLEAVPSPNILEKGASKIILKKPDVQESLKEKKLLTLEPEMTADVETPEFAKMFAGNVASESLAEQKVAKLQSPEEIELSPKNETKQENLKQQASDAFDKAMSELTKARMQMEERYIPRVSGEDVPAIKALSGAMEDGGLVDSDFFGNDVDFAETGASVTESSNEIFEADLRQEVNLSDLTDEELFSLAEDVLGDHIDEDALREKQRSLGVTIERDTFLNTVELIDVAEDDALFKMYGDGTHAAYQQFYKRFLEALANVRDRNKKDLYRLALSKLNLAYKRPFEAMMILDNMPKDEKTGLPLNDAARLMMAVANLTINRPEDALYYMKKDTPDFPEDYAIWNAVYLESKDEDIKAADTFEKHLTHMSSYPLHLMTEAYMSYARVLLRLERLSDLKILMQNLATKDTRGQLPAEAMLLLARGYILERNDELAEALLAQAAASEDPNIAFMAQYEFVDFLLKKGDLGVNQAISHLENLRYLWRGGKVESDILRKLGRMYIYKGRQREGFKRLKQHNIYFPNREKSVEVATDLMTNTFSSLYFDEELKTEHDLVELLGIYYDYRELTPPGDKGDVLISAISERLRALELFERAIVLMEDQLEYRAKTDEDKGRIGMILADLYYQNRQNKEALNTLNRTESPNISKEVQSERDMIQARIFMNMRKYNDALRVLSHLDHPKAKDLVGRISWIQEVYPQVISYLQPIYDKPELLPAEWGSEERVSLMELAVAYNMTGRLRDLESLKNRYKSQIKGDENMSNIFDFLMMDQGSAVVLVPEEKDTVWTKLTDSMNKYHTFVDFYKEFRDKRLESREDKELFNRRMRQISAPARL